METIASNIPENFASLRERLFRISRLPFQILSPEQFHAIADEVINTYFNYRNHITARNIQELLSEVIGLKSEIKELVERYKLNNPEKDIISSPFSETKFTVPEVSDQAEKLLTEELSYYEEKLNDLLSDAKKIDSTTDKSRLKFNMTIKQVVGLMGVLKKCNVINASSNNELCDYIAQNFASIGKFEDYSGDRLPKLIVPDFETASKLIDTLAEVQKQLQLIKNSKK